MIYKVYDVTGVTETLTITVLVTEVSPLLRTLPCGSTLKVQSTKQCTDLKGQTTDVFTPNRFVFVQVH